MKKLNEPIEKQGIGGWLALFQVRMALGFVPILVLPAGPALTVIFFAAMALCLALFYLRRMAFRAAYIFAAVLGIIVCIAALPDGLSYLIVQLVLEAVIIPALYRSRRVKETFVRCRTAHEPDQGHFAVRHRSCYDVYFTTYRCAR